LQRLRVELRRLLICVLKYSVGLLAGVTESIVRLLLSGGRNLCHVFGRISGSLGLRLRSRGSGRDVDYPMSLVEGNDQEIKTVGMRTFLAVFDKQIAHPFRHNRLQKNVVINPLHNEASFAGARIVKVTADDISDRLRKGHSGSDSLSGFHLPDLI